MVRHAAVPAAMLVMAPAIAALVHSRRDAGDQFERGKGMKEAST
jgi:hypothetical protein